MMQGSIRRRWQGVIALGFSAAATSVLLAQAPVLPTVSSPTAAKALVAALQAKKLEAFAMRDNSEPNRYFAVMHVPGVQLLLVAATYERATDIDYRIYTKDF